MKTPRPRRPLAGARVRALRQRLRLGQADMARRAGISVSYLSQIETDERPLTPAVTLAFARAFPHDWSEVEGDDAARLRTAIAEATDDPLSPDPLDDAALARAVEQQPALVRRYVALHAAWRQADEQLKILDDAVDSGVAGGNRLPWEEVRDWFHQSGNYVDAIDTGAEALATQTGGDPARRLAAAHDIRITLSEDDAAPLRQFDPERRLVTLDGAMPPESRAFHLAHELARLELAGPIAATVAGAGLRSEEARQLLTVGLANYAAGAILMPYETFRATAQAVRHDIDRLRLIFGVSFEQACHRLSTLQRPGARGIPFHFCRVDMAGNITKRHSATRLQFARFGGACPLWIVHEAVAIPDRILIQLAETPDGVRYVSMAKGLVKPTGSYARVARRYAVALGCEVAHAREFVYADRLDLAGAGSATPIGVSCRICPREDCDQRAFPPAGRRIVVDPDVRHVVPYRAG
jgi:predicted transcriptional regulator/DNA-binding XRE family transcriptional regulator